MIGDEKTMPTQAEKLHTLNILAKKLRDSRITLKEYLFGFQKSKDSDFFNDYPSLSKDMEEFINLTKKLVSVIDLIPRDCISEIYDLFRISKLTVSDLYIDYEGKKLGLFSLKNLYEKKKFYNSDFSDSFERDIEKMRLLTLSLHNIVKEFSTFQVEIYRLKEIVISNSYSVATGFQVIDSKRYILFKTGDFIFHQPTVFSKEYLSDTLKLCELDNAICETEHTDVSLPVALTLFDDCRNSKPDELFIHKYGLVEQSNNISLDDFSDWLYTDNSELSEDSSDTCVFGELL